MGCQTGRSTLRFLPLIQIFSNQVGWVGWTFPTQPGMAIVSDIQAFRIKCSAKERICFPFRTCTIRSCWTVASLNLLIGI